MQIYRADTATKAEPPGHFGGLEVSDVVADERSTLRVQLSYCPPGGGGERHAHETDAQLFLIARGELSFDAGDERFRLGERDAVLFESGEPHATFNDSDEESIAVVVTVRVR
jgi:quercetin dioxygenase-like cupin family protein